MPSGVLTRLCLGVQKGQIERRLDFKCLHFNKFAVDLLVGEFLTVQDIKIKNTKTNTQAQ